MLTISKPPLFSPDGLAARGQCNHDSPGWQLRWFEQTAPPTLIWQGAFKTCRHLQNKCVNAESVDEVRIMVDGLLHTNSFTHFASQPTDAYPTPGEQRTGEGQPGHGKRKRKKRRH